MNSWHVVWFLHQQHHQSLQVWHFVTAVCQFCWSSTVHIWQLHFSLRSRHPALSHTSRDILLKPWVSAMVQEACHHLLTTEPWVRSQCSVCGFCVGRSGRGIAFTPSCFVSSFNSLLSSAPYSSSFHIVQVLTVSLNKHYRVKSFPSSSQYLRQSVSSPHCMQPGTYHSCCSMFVIFMLAAGGWQYQKFLSEQGNVAAGRSWSALWQLQPSSWRWHSSWSWRRSSTSCRRFCRQCPASWCSIGTAELPSSAVSSSLCQLLPRSVWW